MIEEPKRTIARDSVPSVEESANRGLVVTDGNVSKRTVARIGNVEIVLGKTVDYAKMGPIWREEVVAKMSDILKDAKAAENAVEEIGFFLNTSAYNSTVSPRIWIGKSAYNLAQLSKVLDIKKAAITTSRDDLTIKKLSKALLGDYIKFASRMEDEDLQVVVKFVYEDLPILGIPNAFMAVPADKRVSWLKALKSWENSWQRRGVTRFSDEAASWFSTNPGPIFDYYY